MKTLHSDILIIGGGAAGLTLGILLAQQGIETIVVDPYPAPALKDLQPSGRTVALMNSSLNIIKATGVWDILEERSNPLQTMRLYDDSLAGREPLVAPFHARDIGLAQFGWNVPNGLLRAALFERAKKTKNLKLVSDSMTTYSVHDHGLRSQMDSGQLIEASLIIGADGRSSKVRDIAHIGVRKYEYGQSALTFLIAHEKPHENISTEFHRPSGPLALVPLPGNHSSVVWVEQENRAEELKTMSSDAFQSEFQDTTRGLLGDITIESKIEGWPLCSINAATLTASRTALVAEAVHVMSPITAQGLNLSLRDIASLAEILVDAMRAGVDPGSQAILHQYASARGADINTRTQGVDSMMKLVSQDHPGVKIARRAGLKILDTLPSLKQFAMQQGLAPMADATRLGRGEAL